MRIVLIILININKFDPKRIDKLLHLKWECSVGHLKAIILWTFLVCYKNINFCLIIVPLRIRFYKIQTKIERLEG